MLHWLIDHGYTTCSAVALTNAVGNGFTAVVKLLHDRLGFKRAPLALAAASGRGDIEQVMWLADNGYCEGAIRSAIMAAARNGHNAICQWLLTMDRGFPIEKAVSAALREGQLDMAQSLCESSSIVISDDLLGDALQSDDLVVAEWALSRLTIKTAVNWDALYVRASSSMMRSWVEQQRLEFRL
ncbi:hypothetical protein PINS_up006046 [Pythium insidiosum]|nr:hypothetical protein PINS_up006046 [Pythium insidiosum]